MKIQITIVCFLISVLTASSQITTAPDSTIWTFTVVPENTWLSTSFPTAKKFKVLTSDYKLPISSFFIANMRDMPKNSFGIKTYKVQGQVTFVTEWVYGWYSTRWEETRVYVRPVYFALNLVKD